MKESLNVFKSIRTNSGKYVNVFDPNPDTLLIEDIAHALSHQCRFGGHLHKFYTVAQHLYECYELAPSKHKFSALMHDASEAYLLDFPKPIKMEIKVYNKIEHNFMMVLSKKFKFEYPKNKIVSDIDAYMLRKEWNLLMLNRCGRYKPLRVVEPATAKALFLMSYYKCI
jgi:uncharacterized protein